MSRMQSARKKGTHLLSSIKKKKKKGTKPAQCPRREVSTQRERARREEAHIANAEQELDMWIQQEKMIMTQGARRRGTHLSTHCSHTVVKGGAQQLKPKPCEGSKHIQMESENLGHSLPFYCLKWAWGGHSS